MPLALLFRAFQVDLESWREDHKPEWMTAVGEGPPLPPVPTAEGRGTLSSLCLRGGCGGDTCVSL